MRVIALTEREVDKILDLLENRYDEIKAIPHPEKTMLQNIKYKLEKNNLIV